VYANVVKLAKIGRLREVNGAFSGSLTAEELKSLRKILELGAGEE